MAVSFWNLWTRRDLPDVLGFCQMTLQSPQRYPRLQDMNAAVCVYTVSFVWLLYLLGTCEIRIRIGRFRFDYLPSHHKLLSLFNKNFNRCDVIEIYFVYDF